MGRADRCPPGKLTWAGEAWARGTLFAANDAAASEDHAYWNVPTDAFGPPADENEAGVWGANEAAILTFLTVQSQMRFTPVADGSLATGLDYAGARAGLRLAGLKVSPDLWSDVQVIEAAAVAALNRKS